MKSYLESIKKEIDKGVLSASVKSSTLLETNKIKSYINNLNSKKETMFKVMGEQIYELYINKELEMDKVNNFCLEILEIDKDIKSQYLELEKIKKKEEEILGKDSDEIVCSCGQTLKKDAKFCTSCGEAVAKVCECGTQLDVGAKFCTNCGKKVE